MMEFRKATQEDMAFVRQNPFEGAVKNYPYMEVPDENTYTVIYESAIVAVGGLQIKWEGVGLLWLMLTADCKKHGIHSLLALEAIKEKMEYLIEKNNLWRAEAVIRTDFSQAIKMIEFFGFEREGLMRKYYPDKTDAILYSRIL
jgi:hypothetical protein